jgi:hypothetical protein
MGIEITKALFILGIAGVFLFIKMIDQLSISSNKDKSK